MVGNYVACQLAVVGGSYNECDGHEATEPLRMKIIR
jgi:3-deoxy-D-manno-octulosonic-acid transferase